MTAREFQKLQRQNGFYRTKWQQQQDEVYEKARQRQEKAGYEPLLDQINEIRLDASHWFDKRPYCADCGKLKGSKSTSNYYPDKPCDGCGSLKTTLRNFNGIEIDYQKWLRIENERIECLIAAEAGEQEANYSEF